MVYVWTTSVEILLMLFNHMFSKISIAQDIYRSCVIIAGNIYNFKISAQSNFVEINLENIDVRLNVRTSVLVGYM